MTEARDPDGRLVENILHFTQALRKAGVKVGTAQVETAIEAVAAAGFSKRVDFYHTLRATLITRAEHLEVFHQVFAMFWRDPDFLSSLMQMLSPQLEREEDRRKPDAGQRRAEEALSGSPQRKDAPIRDEVERQAVLTWSGREVIRRKDFDQMSAAELAEAEQAVRDLQFAVKPIRTRRARPDRHGPRADPRATLREARRRAGEIQRIERKAPRLRHPDLVALCDISGSMSVYSRMLLRYLHAISHATTREWGHVHAFTFGTSLTNVTRAHSAGRSRPRARRRRARGQRLGGRHAHRRVAGAVQQDVVAAGADIGRDGAADHRRAGTRRSGPAGPGGRASFPQRRAPRLAQPALTVGWVFAPGGRSAHASGPCRQLPRLPFARQPSRLSDGAGRTGLRDRMLAEARARDRQFATGRLESFDFHRLQYSDYIRQVSGREPSMDMTGEHRIDAPRAVVWEALNDADVLRACIPGCTELEKITPTPIFPPWSCRRSAR
jgi:uncharacterized protein with von Willebrand factor type A (vWA) domain